MLFQIKQKKWRSDTKNKENVWVQIQKINAENKL